MLHLTLAALATVDVSVRSAHVDTLGPQAVDVFYVQESGAGALSEPRAAEAAHAVRAVLGGDLGWLRRTRPRVGSAATRRLGLALGPPPPTLRERHVFATLSDRLADTFKNLRGKGKLSEADIDATAREIRIALLEADVALPVVKEFVAAVKERARGEEVSQALNPAQQVVKIVNDELVEILGGETRRLRFAKSGPTVIMLAGLQGAGKTTLAAKLALWLKEQGRTPLLVAADLQRPNAVNQLQVNGERVGVPVFAPEAGNGVGDPVAVARGSIEEARRKLHDVVIVDTAGRLGVDAEMMQQAADIRDAVDPDEVLFVVDAMIGQDAVTTAQAFLDGVGYDARRADQARRRRPRWRRALDRQGHRQAGHVRLRGREDDRLRPLPPGPDGLADPRHG